ncbi:hypothetical protein BX666DRAFT_1907605 [Dichotomocladium elegans]|nr:hypothetical protein BX666DRAFT_1907605 [Dichotomocladium elegans]
MPLDPKRHHAMSISSLIVGDEDDGSNGLWSPLPVMSPSLSSTTSSSSSRYSPQSFASTSRSKSSPSLFEESTTTALSAEAGTLLLDTCHRPQSIDERRRRNKEASARYRAKRNQRNEDMRNVVAKLIHQNNVLFTALQEAYEHQGRDAPKSMDEVFNLMNKAQEQHQQHYTPTAFPSPPSYSSPPLSF